MNARRTDRFDSDLKNAPLRVQKDFEKQLRFLLRDLRHTSLRAKKYDEARDIWQARVNRDWRFYFQIDVSSGETSWMRDDGEKDVTLPRSSETSEGSMSTRTSTTARRESPPGLRSRLSNRIIEDWGVID